jgi:hypothetical protein
MQNVLQEKMKLLRGYEKKQKELGFTATLLLLLLLLLDEAARMCAHSDVRFESHLFTSN